MGDVWRLSWGRLRSSENAACRRALAVTKPPAGLGFTPMGDVCVVCDVWCVVCGVCCIVLCCVALSPVVLWCVVYGVWLCGVVLC